MAGLTLRTKTVLLGGLIAAGVSAVASTSTFLVARQYMVRQRDDAAVTQVLAATRLATSALANGSEPLTALLTGAQLVSNSRAAMYFDGTWIVSSAGLSESDIPTELTDALAAGAPARQRYSLRDETNVAVGYPISDRPATWFIGVVSMSELDRTLRVLLNALFAGSTLAVIGGGVIGWWLSRRVMEPLHAISAVAKEISQGDLTRVAPEPNEPDLARIAHTFNEMTGSLRDRIEREVRFGATVSHELRSPLTVIRGAADLIAAKRDELPERARLGLDLLNERVDAFEKILNDLIEMSRYESGTATAVVDSRSASTLVLTLADRAGIDLRMVDVPDIAVEVDVKRFQQIFENLSTNAALYGNRLVAIRADTTAEMLHLHFDDAGTGIPPDDRDRIFAPFERGIHHSAVPGSGLGLAISAEHARLMHGRLTVDVSPEGGARFTLTLRRSLETPA
jgi:two-component system sensor histidine kinase MtrB